MYIWFAYTRLINYDIALSLHHTMFIPAIERLATDEQKSKWLPLALSYQIIGTYAQTELGHGRLSCKEQFIQGIRDDSRIFFFISLNEVTLWIRFIIAL